MTSVDGLLSTLSVSRAGAQQSAACLISADSLKIRAYAENVGILGGTMSLETATPDDQQAEDHHNQPSKADQAGRREQDLPPVAIAGTVILLAIAAIGIAVFPDSSISNLFLPFAGLVIYADYTRRSGERATDRTRERLLSAAEPERIYYQVEGDLNISTPPGDKHHFPEYIEIDQASQAERDILIEMYSRRVGQAQTWFRTSIGFGAVGAAILLIGISLAISHANSSGQRYAAIIASSASVVTNILALVFFRQSNIAQKIMATQVEQLQESLRSQRQAAEARHALGVALDLIERIEDSEVKDQHRAKLAMSLAERPC